MVALISTKVLGHDEEIETRPKETILEKEVQTKEPHDLRSGATHEEEVQLEKPQDLKGRGQEEKKPQKIQEQEQVETIPIPKKRYLK